MSARSNLFNKINISASATINPYLYDSTGRDIDRLVWKEKTLTLGRITGGNVSLSTSFQGGEKDKKQTTDQLKRGVNPMTGLPLTEDQEEAAYISNNPAEYTDFSIPWSVQFGYALRFSQIFNTTTKGFKTKFNSDINLSGSLALTEKWQLGLEWRLFLVTGFLGGFTTFSAFSVETHYLIKSGHIGVAVTYIVSSIIMGIGLTFLGVWLFRLVPR